MITLYSDWDRKRNKNPRYCMGGFLTSVTSSSFRHVITKTFSLNPDRDMADKTGLEGPDALSSPKVDQTRTNDFVFKFLLNIHPTSRALMTSLARKSTFRSQTGGRIIAGPWCVAKIMPYADFLKLNHKLLSIKVLPTINVLLPTAEKKVSGNLSSERKESIQLCCQYV